MTQRAYNEIYLSDAKENLGQFFHYGTYDCGLSPQELSFVFTGSSCARYFGKGIPKYICGMSGAELLQEAIRECRPDFACPTPSFSPERTPEYWCGWALAEYQWHSARSFESIFSQIPIEEMLLMYPTFHEADISCFIEAMDAKMTSPENPTNLKIMRKQSGLSQGELAEISGVGLRSIQMYEQRINDIDKAQAQTVLRLARALHCPFEALLENP